MFEGKDIIWNTMSDVQHWGWYKLFLFDCVDRKEVTGLLQNAGPWLVRGGCERGALWWRVWSSAGQHRRGRTHHLNTRKPVSDNVLHALWVLEITCNVLQLLLHEMTMVNCIATCLEPLRIPWQPLITFSGCSLSYELETLHISHSNDTFTPEEKILDAMDPQIWSSLSEEPLSKV